MSPLLTSTFLCGDEPTHPYCENLVVGWLSLFSSTTCGPACVELLQLICQSNARAFKKHTLSRAKAFTFCFFFINSQELGKVGMTRSSDRGAMSELENRA
ncbi:hypothetical protein KP509_11G011300 [Ceratopteris richardii]|uniref:Uncharacterized protein n=1 Tax=Ceratopteris richardii TaxID=49495 RepID=A0A8T2TM15_CERRI|nr:hypothetical protein KP509_11G011300 [Ceratopteris richardii]